MSSIKRDSIKAAYAKKTSAELEALALRGVCMGGNAFAQVLVVKATEKNGGPAFGGRDGAALKAAFARLGYAPEDWAWLLSCDDAGHQLDVAIFREALAALDPSTVVLCDETSAQLVRESFAQELSQLPKLEEAMLSPGSIVLLRGIRMCALGDFDAALDSDAAKQQAWRTLKQLAPLGEPF